MSSNVRAFPMTVMPPQPSQQDWVWDGANWCPPGGVPMPPSCIPPTCPPFPCPPPGFPTPCPPWFPPPAGQAPWYPGANGGVSFSPTPPDNPIRGHLWWDGTSLHLFDGAVWESIGPATSSVLAGVTDGSNAAPGYVGEFITGNSAFNYPAATYTTFNLTPLVMPAGDWNMWAFMGVSTAIDSATFYLNPIPLGVSNGMGALSGVKGTPTGPVSELATMVCPMARGSFSVPTALAFFAAVDQTAGSLPAGNGYLNVNARRVR